jgi:hypothetical protein
METKVAFPEESLREADGLILGLNRSGWIRRFSSRLGRLTGYPRDVECGFTQSDAMPAHNMLKHAIASLVSLLFISFSLFPFLSKAAEPPQPPQRVEVKDGLISVDVKDIELPWLMKELEQRTGIPMKVADGLAGERLTASFQNLDVENALKTILKTHFLFVLVKDHTGNKPALKEVSLIGRLSRKSTSERVTTVRLEYGSGQDQIGVDRSAHVGPYSFAVDADGRIYILDTVNSRIQIFSADGHFRSTVPFQLFGADIVVDSAGMIYVRDIMVPELYQFDQKGTALAKIPINPDRWGAQREIHIVSNGTIYSRACTESQCGEFKIGRIINGSLLSPSYEELNAPLEPGQYGITGRRYSLLDSTQGEETEPRFLRVCKGEQTELQILEKDGRRSLLIYIPLTGRYRPQFLGEDEGGHFFLLTSRTDVGCEGRVYDPAAPFTPVDDSDQGKEGFDEVYRFGADGASLDTVSLPQIKPNFWSVRHYLIGPNGTVYSFSTERDALTLTITQTQTN